MEIPKDTTVFRGSPAGWFQHQRPAPGLYLVHKPVGETSFGLVRRFQEALEAAPGKPLKVCHGGVLDPFAHGLVVVLVGQATKLFDFLHDVPKGYRGTARFGQETDTGDAGGAVVPSASDVIPPAAARDAALAGFSGWVDQIPPATSNKRVDGERAYARAHRGEAVTLPATRVFLHAARFTAHEAQTSQLELQCAGGFYVRSLVRDVGRALGCGAHLTALERTHLGPWRCPGSEELVHVSGAALLPWLPSLALTDDEWGLLKGGKAMAGRQLERAAWPVPEGFPPPAQHFRALHGGRLVALLHRTDAGFVPRVLLPGGV